MAFLDQMERKLGWLTFPSLLRIYAIFHALVYLMQLIRPNVGELFDFNMQAILSGEVWRAVTFLFASAGYNGVSLFGVVFIVFAVSFMFMVNDGLEQAWGEFRTSMYLYMGMLCLIAANFLFMGRVPGSGYYLYASAFLAFATLYPKVEVRLFMVIPVQVRFLAMFLAFGLIVRCVVNPYWFLFFLIALSNYLLFVGIPTLKGRKLLIQASQRRKRFKAAQPSASEAFHTCSVCKRTEISDRELEFRIGADGQEYCDEHLPASE